MTAELIVAGFHRSGTSMTMQALQEEGLFVGFELIGADASNPYGHFEDAEALSIHNEILEANGRNWKVDRPLLPAVNRRDWNRMERFIDRRRAAHTFWGFKDPRVCLFLGLWRHLMPDALVLVVYRDVEECVASLHRRHGSQLVRGYGGAHLHLPFFQEPDLALKMWLVHNEALVREARAFPDTTKVVSFASLAAGFPLFDRLRRDWDLPVRAQAGVETFDASVTTRDAGAPVLDDALAARAEQLMADLEELHLS